MFNVCRKQVDPHRIKPVKYNLQIEQVNPKLFPTPSIILSRRDDPHVKQVDRDKKQVNPDRDWNISFRTYFALNRI